MKKTVSINLNSFMFVIDEDAYNVLHLYLGKLEAHFAKLEEGGEIVKDIESRIAEIFNMKINNNKQVINIQDVEEVIQILGNVEDITGDEEEENVKSGNEKSKRKSKKLFRDPENNIIGGVCSGLAEFTGISTTTWRIIFLIFLFFGQVSIIAYLILWIAVPEAKTTAQKLEMKGDKINLSNIEKTVKQEFEDVKKNFRKMDTKKVSDIFINIGQAFMTVISVLGRVFGKLLGIFFLIIGASIITALTIALISVGKDNLVYTNDFISMIWLPGLLGYVTNSTGAWFLSICLLIVFIIPVIAIINWGVLLLFDVKVNKYLSIGTFSVWVLAIILSAAATINIGTQFRSLDTKLKKEIIVPDSTNTYSFKLSPEYNDFTLPKEEDIDDFNDLHIFINSHFIMADGKKLQSFPKINFYPSEDTVAGMEIKYYSRGSNTLQAKENIKQINYSYTNDTGMVYLSPYFQINAPKWRDQEVKISVFIPVGAKLYIDQKMSPLIDIEDATGQFEDEDLAGKNILVTSGGFVLM